MERFVTNSFPTRRVVTELGAYGKLDWLSDVCQASLDALVASVPTFTEFVKKLGVLLACMTLAKSLNMGNFTGSVLKFINEQFQVSTTDLPQTLQQKVTESLNASKKRKASSSTGEDCPVDTIPGVPNQAEPVAVGIADASATPAEPAKKRFKRR